jgi:hypothetical protein
MANETPVSRLRPSRLLFHYNPTSLPMSTQPTPNTPLGITIPPASTDELLHALSATVITQQATINVLSGLLLQVYCQVNQLPNEVGEDLHDRLFASSLTSAAAGFTASILERRQMVRDVMHQ